MPKQVIHGSLHIAGRDVGKVVARVADRAVGDHLAGTIILVGADRHADLPAGEWVPGWLAPTDAGPAIAVAVRRRGSGGLEFRAGH